MTGFLNHWKANSVRFTVFPVDLGVATTIEWNEFAGTEPESNEVRPREKVRRQTGSINGAQLLLTATIDRLDIVASPQPNVPQGLTNFAGPVLTAGTFDELFSEHHSVFNEWLALHRFPIKRIAVGGLALLPASSPDHSYEQLDQLIKAFQVKFGDICDLTYRVNRRARPLNSSLLFYNRLTTFASVGFQGANFASMFTHASPAEFFTSLDVDLNTPAERSDALPASELIPISNELADLLRENLDQGECLVRPN